MHCDVWALVHDVLQQRTGQTLWSHQYGHDHGPFHGKANLLAKQAAAAHPLQLRSWVPRRLGEPLAPLGSRNARLKINAEGASEVAAASGPV